MLKQFFSFPNQSKVGDVVQSMLTEAQFQAERDSTWVLMDGRDVTGSDFATITGSTTVPDGRGEFLRGNDNGRGVDTGRALGSSQGSQNLSHGHGGSIGYAGNHSHNIPIGDNSNGSGRAQRAINNLGWGFSTTTNGNHNHAVYINADGGAEARPRNITVNHFIKINRTN